MDPAQNFMGSAMVLYTKLYPADRIRRDVFQVGAAKTQLVLYCITWISWGRTSVHPAQCCVPVYCTLWGIRRWCSRGRLGSEILKLLRRPKSPHPRACGMKSDASWGVAAGRARAREARARPRAARPRAPHARAARPLHGGGVSGKASGRKETEHFHLIWHTWDRKQGYCAVLYCAV